MLRYKVGMSSLTKRTVISKCFAQGNKRRLCSHLLAILPAQRYKNQGDYPKQDEYEVEELEKESAAKEPNKHCNLKYLARQRFGEGTILPPPLRRASM